MCKSTMAFCVLFLTACAMAQQEKAKIPEFPSTDEIQLVVTQSERVLEQYKQSVTTESELPSFKRDPSAIQKDTGVYEMGMKLVDALKKHPERLEMQHFALRLLTTTLWRPLCPSPMSTPLRTGCTSA
jgi:hypothetical protein